MKLKILFLQLIIASLWVAVSQAMLPDRKAFVFFAVHRDSTVVAVQSNSLPIADDSLSPSLTLSLLEVRDMPSGGGSAVLGFTWANGSAYGAVSSEGRLRAASVAKSLWSANATLYGRFEVRDGGGGLFTSWETPIFLRTIEYVEFVFLQNGSTATQIIPGALPSSTPTYEFTGFQWVGTPKDDLTGATVTFNHASGGRVTDLEVTGTPTVGWSVDDAPFDLTITSQATSPFDVCTAEFKGLSWDGLDTPVAAAQPKVTLRRLESDGQALLGYYWIRGQISGGAAINASLPMGASATGVIQNAPYAGTEVPLDTDCKLDDLGFTPAYPSSNQIVVRVESAANGFPVASSQPRLLAFRQFDIDYAPECDWILPFEDDPAMVPEANRTLGMGGEDAFAFSIFVDTFTNGTDLDFIGPNATDQGAIIGWPVGGLVAGDNGTIEITMKHLMPGLPESRVRVSVCIEDDSENRAMPWIHLLLLED